MVNAPDNAVTFWRQGAQHSAFYKADKRGLMAIAVRRLRSSESSAARNLLKTVASELSYYSREDIDAEVNHYYTVKGIAQLLKTRTSLIFGTYDGKRLVGLVMAFYELGGLVLTVAAVDTCGDTATAHFTVK